jgi:hypothetical protein
MWGLMNTYDMLKNVLGWQSLDGNNTATYIAAHVNTAYDNAYYSDTCRCMFIGDGNSFQQPRLDRRDRPRNGPRRHRRHLEPDLFGRVGRPERVELGHQRRDRSKPMRAPAARATRFRPAATTGCWARRSARTAQPLRWMYKPSKDGSSPDAWSSTLNLDVHYSSGPNNRMFYFLSQGSSSDADYYSKYLVKAPLAMTASARQGLPDLVPGEHDQVHGQHQLCAGAGEDAGGGGGGHPGRAQAERQQDRERAAERGEDEGRSMPRGRFRRAGPEADQ